MDKRSLKRELEKQSEEVLLSMAIELDRDMVQEAYSIGLNKDDIVKLILKHIKSAVGRSDIQDSGFIQDVEITDARFEVSDRK